MLSIDGVIAGFAPVYPVLFTGGGGPGAWEPIPSPRAWHLDPYRLDLTPFVGQLVDGQPHVFRIDIPDAAYGQDGDTWIVGANLFGTVDAASTQTSGMLTSTPVAASATTGGVADPTGGAVQGNAPYFTGSRDGAWTGYVVGSAGRTDTSVTSHFDMTATVAVDADSTWHWNTSSQVTAGSATPVTTAATHTYTLKGGTGPGTYGDSATFSVSGPNAYNSSYDLELVTVGAVEANGTEAETYNGSDSTGYCYQRIINTASGYVVSDQTSPICLSTSTGGTTTGSTSGGSTGGSTTGSTTGGSTGGGTSGGSTTGGSTTGGSTGSTTGGTGGGSTGGTTSGGSTGGSTSGGSTSGGSTTGGGTSGGSSTGGSSTGGSGGSTTGAMTGSSTTGSSSGSTAGGSTTGGTAAPAPAAESRTGGGAFGLPALSMLLLMTGLRRRRR